MNTKRFLLFGYDNYYPSGGWDDFLSAFDTKQECYDELLRRKERFHSYDHYDIVDLETMEIVARQKG